MQFKASICKIFANDWGGRDLYYFPRWTTASLYDIWAKRKKRNYCQVLSLDPFLKHANKSNMEPKCISCWNADVSRHLMGKEKGFQGGQIMHSHHIWLESVKAPMWVERKTSGTAAQHSEDCCAKAFPVFTTCTDMQRDRNSSNVGTTNKKYTI